MRDFKCPKLVFPCEFAMIDTWEDEHFAEIPWSCLEAMGIKKPEGGKAAFFSSEEARRYRSHKHYRIVPKEDQIPTNRNSPIGYRFIMRHDLSGTRLEKVAWKSDYLQDHG